MMKALVPAALAVLLGVVPEHATAQQPLSEFLAAAASEALDVREAEASLSAARSQTDEARARLLPSVTGTLGYQRNDPSVVVAIPTGMLDAMGMPVTRQATITPLDQTSAQATATVPLLDLGAWTSLFQSRASADAVEARADLARESVAVRVTELYYQLVAQRALVRVADENLETADRMREESAARVEVGASAQLELSRAEAELARARGAKVAAELAATLAARNLEDIAGLAPTDERVELDSDLAPATPLSRFLGHTAGLPAVRAADEERRALEIGRNAAWMSLLPTVSANAAARYSNGAGFGRQDVYYVGVSAAWTLDFAKPARIGTANAQLDAAEIRRERAARSAETAIFEAWQRVQATRASAESALAGLEASRRAASDARARFETGTATQLDQIQAERDLFTAEVGYIQALASHRVARDVLATLSGVTP